MAANPVLTVLEVREFVSDYAPNNFLIEGAEFSDTFINLCIEMAISEFNTLTPTTAFTELTFPSKAVLLNGALWKMYDGKASLLARNTMNYSDGGLQIPIEERAELYKSLATDFYQKFQTGASRLKIQMNMDDCWGSVSSDAYLTPLW